MPAVDRAPGAQLGQVVIFKNLDDVKTSVTMCTHRGPCTECAAGANPYRFLRKIYKNYPQNPLKNNFKKVHFSP